jgi:hypothetical protein
MPLTPAIPTGAAIVAIIAVPIVMTLRLLVPAWIATIIVAPVGRTTAVWTLTILLLVLLVLLGAEAIILLALLPISLLALILLSAETVVLLTLVCLLATLLIELLTLVLLRTKAVALLTLLIHLLTTLLLVELRALVLLRAEAIILLALLIHLLTTLLELRALLRGSLLTLLRRGPLRMLLLPLGSTLLLTPSLVVLGLVFMLLLRPTAATGQGRGGVEAQRAQSQSCRQTESDRRSVYTHLRCLLFPPALRASVETSSHLLAERRMNRN